MFTPLPVGLFDSFRSDPTYGTVRERPQNGFFREISLQRFHDMVFLYYRHRGAFQNDGFNFPGPEIAKLSGVYDSPIQLRWQFGSDFTECSKFSSVLVLRLPHPIFAPLYPTPFAYLPALIQQIGQCRQTLQAI